MKASELIQMNAMLQDSLSKENDLYYGNLVVYFRIKAMIRDEYHAEEALLEVLQDILEAQKNGISAEDYFSKNPKQVADEMICQLPLNIPGFIKLVASTFGIFLLFSTLPKLIFPAQGLDIGIFLLSGLFWAGAIFVLLKLIGLSVYHFKKRLLYVVIWLALSLAFLAFFLSKIYLKPHTPWVIHLNGALGILFILLITASAIYFTRSFPDRKMQMVFIPVITTSALLGIMTRISFFQTYLASWQGKLVIAGVLVISLALQLVLQFLAVRGLEKKN